MQSVISILAICLLLASPTSASLVANKEDDAEARLWQPEDGDSDDSDDSTAATEPGPVAPIELSAASAPSASPAQTSAESAHDAAEVAKNAATVANKVAEHSIKVTGHAKKALKHALGALHDARVESSGLKDGQKESLKKAEAHLREATKKAEYGELKKVKDAQDLEKEEMKAELDKTETKQSEKEELLQEVEALRQKLEGKAGHNKKMHKALDKLEAAIEKGDSNDETKAKLEKLREKIEKLPDDSKEEEKKEEEKEEKKEELKAEESHATPVEEKGIDIDTQMPYGDLEPFGREDTAQELTESSVRESDEMVDQLERAEVAEEKRAVFRALTRLRGAAITSFDGVARSQTGNIDEYAKTTKWRNAHPVHHLADEESDITKWAFPDNADFMQTKK